MHSLNGSVKSGWASAMARRISRPRPDASPSASSTVALESPRSVVCQKCSTTLFRYKKKNGLKSSLVKCYIERIVDDPLGLLAAERGSEMECPKCKSRFARDALIHGRPALKMVGGKVRMTK